MRSIWQGTLELGDVAIPVGIVPTLRDGSQRFKRLHDACKSPIRLRSYCELEQELIEDDALVTAWEVVPGEYLVLDEAEQQALKPEESRRVPIGCFFQIDELDPVYVRQRYWLAPAKTPIGRRGYAVFAEAMHDLEVAALTRFVWKGEKLGAIYSPDGTVLELLVLHVAEDVTPVEPLHQELEDVACVPGEIQLARTLISRHTRQLSPDVDLVSVERPRVRELIEAKLAGQPIVRPASLEVAPPGPVSGDLAAALKSSIKKAPTRRRRPAAAGVAG